MTDRDETISEGTDSPRSPINFPVPGSGGASSGGAEDAGAGGGAVAGDALLPTTIPQVVEESADDAGPGGRSAARPTT